MQHNLFMDHDVHTSCLLPSCMVLDVCVHGHLRGAQCCRRETRRLEGVRGGQAYEHDAY